MLNWRNFGLLILTSAAIACSPDTPKASDAQRSESAALATPTPTANQTTSTNQTMSLRQTSDQTDATRITDNIYMAKGFGNSFLVTTADGNVIIDTSLPTSAPAHKALLNKVDSRPPEYIIITHAHGDHIGGIPTWKTADTKVVQQEHAREFLHYQDRLKGFFQRRNAAQFGFDLTELNAVEVTGENFGATIPADILFKEKHSFSLGDLTFDVIATPSETHDALSVWIPERKAVFVGDLYYESFPNLYTLRGTKPRWALDYVNSLQKIMNLQPEILIPSHGDPIFGAAKIQDTLGQYRDAILYVHDAVVAGMNRGEGVDDLVRSITLPEALKIPEIYGRVDWSVRGIYLGYAGWFDGDPSTMLGGDKTGSTAALIDMAGGADAVVLRAQQYLITPQSDMTDMDNALALADLVLSVEPTHVDAAKVRRAVFQMRLRSSTNFNETGWLQAGIGEADKVIQPSK